MPKVLHQCKTRTLFAETFGVMPFTHFQLDPKEMVADAFVRLTTFVQAQEEVLLATVILTAPVI